MKPSSLQWPQALHQQLQRPCLSTLYNLLVLPLDQYLHISFLQRLQRHPATFLESFHQCWPQWEADQQMLQLLPF